jgi:hypothetical protein
MLSQKTRALHSLSLLVLLETVCQRSNLNGVFALLSVRVVTLSASARLSLRWLAARVLVGLELLLVTDVKHVIWLP